jgi:uncharacterized protein HemY
MEATKSMMLLREQIKTKAPEYSIMGTKSLCSSERVDAPNQDGVQLQQRFVAHQKELCSLKKKTEKLESTLKMQSAEIKRLRKLTEDSEDLFRLLRSSKR